jgi:hypothetical protein
MQTMQPYAQEFMVFKNGQQLGPYPRQTLLENVRLGNFTLDDMVWHPQMQSWEAFRYQVTREEMSLIVPTYEYYPPPVSQHSYNNYHFAQSQPYLHPPAQIPQAHKHAGGLAQTFGLDFRVALIAVVIDTMLFAGEIATLGALIVLSAIVGGVFGFITYKAQRSWYGDDHDSAVIKALIMGLLTAIPTALPAFLYVPAGLIGLVKKLRGR